MQISIDAAKRIVDGFLIPRQRRKNHRKKSHQPMNGPMNLRSKSNEMVKMLLNIDSKRERNRR